VIVYRDMTFCSRKSCTFIHCPRHHINVPWNDLPEGVGVSIADMHGHEVYCPVENPPFRFPWEKGKEDEET